MTKRSQYWLATLLLLAGLAFHTQQALPQDGPKSADYGERRGIEHELEAFYEELKSSGRPFVFLPPRGGNIFDGLKRGIDRILSLFGL